jgi:archaellum biogenesis protein FlaJ (TadC family)
MGHVSDLVVDIATVEKENPVKFSTETIQFLLCLQAKFLNILKMRKKKRKNTRKFRKLAQYLSGGLTSTIVLLKILDVKLVEISGKLGKKKCKTSKKIKNNPYSGKLNVLIFSKSMTYTLIKFSGIVESI